MEDQSWAWGGFGVLVTFLVLYYFLCGDENPKQYIEKPPRDDLRSFDDLELEAMSKRAKRLRKGEKARRKAEQDSCLGAECNLPEVSVTPVVKEARPVSETLDDTRMGGPPHEYKTWAETCSHSWVYWRRDKEKGVFVKYDPYRTDNTPQLSRTPHPYQLGWQAFEKKDFLEKNGEDLAKLCPYDKESLDNIEWWRGWYESAKFDWYWRDMRGYLQDDVWA